MSETEKRVKQAVEDWFLNGDAARDINVDEELDAFFADESTFGRDDVKLAMETFVDENRCDRCASAGDNVLGIRSLDIYDEGAGWISHSYCQECFDVVSNQCADCGDENGAVNTVEDHDGNSKRVCNTCRDMYGSE